MSDDMHRMADVEGLSSVFANLGRIADAVERLANHACKPTETAISKDTMAISLALTMAKPSLRKIAKELGYANHTSLRSLRQFTEMWPKIQALKSIDVRSSSRSVVNRDHADEFDD